MFVAKRNRHVRVIVRRIEHTLRRNDLHVDIRHQRLELRKARHQPVGGETKVGGQSERLRRTARPDLGSGMTDGVERKTHRIEKPLAVFGKPDTAMAAFEKGCAQRLFELHDALAYCRLRRTQLSRGRGETRETRGGFEHCQCLHWRQAVLPRHNAPL